MMTILKGKELVDMAVQDINISTIRSDIDDLILIKIDSDQVNLDESRSIFDSIKSMYPKNHILLLPKNKVQIKALPKDAIKTVIEYLEDCLKE